MYPSYAYPQVHAYPIFTWLILRSGCVTILFSLRAEPISINSVFATLRLSLWQTQTQSALSLVRLRLSQHCLWLGRRRCLSQVPGSPLTPRVILVEAKPCIIAAKTQIFIWDVFKPAAHWWTCRAYLLLATSWINKTPSVRGRFEENLSFVTCNPDIKHVWYQVNVSRTLIWKL